MSFTGLAAIAPLQAQQSGPRIRQPIQQAAAHFNVPALIPQDNVYVNHSYLIYILVVAVLVVLLVVLIKRA